MKEIFKKLSIYFTGDALHEAKEIMYKTSEDNRFDFLHLSDDEPKDEIIDFILFIKHDLIKNKELDKTSDDKYFINGSY